MCIYIYIYIYIYIGIRRENEGPWQRVFWTNVFVGGNSRALLHTLALLCLAMIGGNTVKPHFRN